MKVIRRPGPVTRLRIANLEHQLATLDAWKVASTAAAEMAHWVVLSPNGLRPMAFDFYADSGHPDNPRTVTLQNATRFPTLGRARRVAECIRAGELSGKPVTVAEAFGYIRCELQRELANTYQFFNEGE